MKSVILWIVALFVLYVAVVAVQMGEYAIAAVLGAITVGCVWAAPSGTKTGKKSKSRAGR